MVGRLNLTRMFLMKIKTILFPIFGLCFWIYIFSSTYISQTKKLLTVDNCYNVDNINTKLIKKNTNEFVFENKKVEKYVQIKWITTGLKETSCELDSKRGIASNTKKVNKNLINSFFDYCKETVDIIW